MTDFLDDWLDYLEDEEGAQFEEDSSGDFDIWSYEEEMQVYALSEDRLVLATTEDALDEVLDLISGKDRKSLAETTGFKEARGAMQDGRVLSLYVNTEDLLNVVSDVSAIDVMPRAGKDGILRVPKWGAASARFLDRGLAMEIVVLNNSEFAATIDKIDTPAKVLPEDTLGFFGASFDPDMDNWRAELEDYTLKDLGFPSDFEHVLDEMELDTSSRDPRRELSLESTFDEILDIGIDIVEELTNINLEQDFFDYLRGQAIISVQDFDFERAEDIENYTVDVAAMLSYDPNNKEELTDTMDDVTGFIESSGLVTSDGEDVGAEEDATIFNLEEPMGDTAYSPGYVLHDGYLIIGSTQNALESIADVQNGDSEALAGAPEYRRIRDHLPDTLQALMFIDLQRIISQLNPDQLGMDRQEFEILEEGFSAIAAGSNTDAKYSRSLFVLTLFPE